MTGPLTVLYLAGSGRSGSTIVDNVLGEIPGFFSGGEMRFVWDRNVRDDRVCGCREPFSRCALWQQVMRTAYGDDVPPADEVVGWRETAIRLRSAPVAGLAGTRERLRRENVRYLRTLEKFYHATAEVTGARVVVDSSKYPSYGYLLSLIDSIDVVMVHLVRDPRAVAHSWTRTKIEVTTEGTTVPMGRVSPRRTALDWMLWSVLAEQYGRAMARQPLRVRYEDFVCRPRDTVGAILAHAGLAPEPLEFIDDGSVHLSGNHTVGGNPGRLRSGSVPIRVDDAWRTAMSPADRRAVTAITLPRMAAYGYLRRSP